MSILEWNFLVDQQVFGSIILIIILSYSEKFERKNKFVYFLMILYLDICNFIATDHNDGKNPAYFIVGNFLIIYMISMFAKINKE